MAVVRDLLAPGVLCKTINDQFREICEVDSNSRLTATLLDQAATPLQAPKPVEPVEVVVAEVEVLVDVTGAVVLVEDVLEVVILDDVLVVPVDAEVLVMLLEVDVLDVLVLVLDVVVETVSLPSPTMNAPVPVLSSWIVVPEIFAPLSYACVAPALAWSPTMGTLDRSNDLDA